MTSVQNCSTRLAITGPRHTTGSVSFFSKRLLEMTLIPVDEVLGYNPSRFPRALSLIPKILGIEGPVTSASNMPT